MVAPYWGVPSREGRKLYQEFRARWSYKEAGAQPHIGGHPSHMPLMTKPLLSFLTEVGNNAHLTGLLRVLEVTMGIKTVLTVCTRFPQGLGV